MKRYLLDTNACVDYLTQRYPSVAQRLWQTPPESVLLSSVVLAELRYGADKSTKKQMNHARLDRLSEEIQTLDFDLAAARAFGKIRAALEEKGSVIGAYDMLIAAHAVSLEVTLVTDNVREFGRIAGLKLENWREA